MRRLLPLICMVPFVAAACGGGRLAHPVAEQLVVPLGGRTDGVATLRRAADGEKTRLEVRLAAGAPRSELSVQLARGSCRRPTALTSETVLGGMHGRHAAWTVPTPLGQLANGRALAVVVRSPRHPVVACGNAPR
ncbi:MAG TPA: hypothetical protein VFL60_01675 [Gaiellaceae bacterium]|nr:hypothetical protein [Gaiellaceae bacterium]